MRMLNCAVATVILALAVYSCAPVLVGGLIWKSQKSKSEKQKFLKELNEINLEREKAGLKPLDVCVEMYHFDPGWAIESADCKEKIDSLQAEGIQPDSSKVFHKIEEPDQKPQEEDRW